MKPELASDTEYVMGRCVVLCIRAAYPQFCKHKHSSQSWGVPIYSIQFVCTLSVHCAKRIINKKVSYVHQIVVDKLFAKNKVYTFSKCVFCERSKFAVFIIMSTKTFGHLKAQIFLLTWKLLLHIIFIRSIRFQIIFWLPVLFLEISRLQVSILKKHRSQFMQKLCRLCKQEFHLNYVFYEWDCVGVRTGNRTIIQVHINCYKK